MKTNEIIREMMSEKGIRGIDLAKKLGIGKTALANRLERGVMNTAVLRKMMDIFGYKIVLVPKETEMGEDWYEIGNEEEGGHSDVEG